MTQQARNDLIEECLAKRIDIDLNRAHELASMAVDNQYPDDSYTEEESYIWVCYRLIVMNRRLTKRRGSA